MKHRSCSSFAVAAALGFCISLGGVGCMVSAFELTLKSYPALVLVCMASACLCAACFRLKRGGTVILCLLTLLAGYLWRSGEAAQQVFQLLYRISYIYNRAYGWGVLRLVDTPWDAGFADLPMAILALLLSIAVTGTVCRRKSSVYAVLFALLPLFSCLVVTDTVPDVGYLFLLLLGLILLILTGRVRRRSAPQGDRLTLIAALPTALALGLLFLAVPQEGYVNRAESLREDILNWFAEIPQSVENAVQELPVNTSAGEAENLDLQSLGRRIESTAVVMEVTPEIGGTLYLRGQDYDSYNGTGWSASERRSEAFSGGGEDYGNVVIRTRSRLEELYLPYYPAGGMTLIGGRMENTWKYTEYSIHRTGLPDGWWEKATAVSVDEGAADLLIDAAASESAQNRLRYRTLPNATRARAEALLEQILTDESGIAEIALKIADYVRNSAEYDLDPGRMPDTEEDFALWFLEDAEQGYCVHFATAAVVLLRAAGIDARYVSGYMVKTNPGQTAELTGENAHAWAEYYLPSLDTWVVLEATPADTNAAREPSPTPGTETAPTEAQEQTEAPESTQADTSQMEETAQTAPEQRKSFDFGPILRVLKTVLTATLAVTIAMGQRTARIRLRRRRQRSGTPNDRALARWQEAELLAKLLKQSPPEELEQLAQKAKFSQHTLTAEELTRFDGYLRTARAELRQKPWYLRLVHQYIFAAY